jgi:hypothetical protein
MARKGKTRTIVRRVAAAKPRVNVAGRLAKARERHTLAAVAAAAAVGYAQSPDPDKPGEPRIKLPTIGGLDPASTAGVVAFGLGMATKNKTIEHIATGLLSVAVYELGKKGFRMSPPTVSGYGYQDDVVDVGFVDAD